ncbi:MAG: hypothetical protein AAFS10_23835 [Myxococcota bacterium]
MRPTTTSPLGFSNPWRLLWTLALLWGLTWTGMAACYTPAEMRAKAAALPDPRDEQAGKLWEALVVVADEQRWDIELKRREDLILTGLSTVDDNLRQRIRCLIFKTPYAVGLNVTIKFEQRSSDNPEWTPIQSPELAARGKADEQHIAGLIYTRWQASR